MHYIYSAMVLNIVAVLGIVSLCIYAGLVAHAKYFDCDPLGAGVSFYRYML